MELELELNETLGLSNEAVESFEKMLNEANIDATQLSTDFAQGVYASAYKYYQNRKYAEAINLFRLLTVLDPQNYTYWLGLGAAQQMNKELDKALLSYTFAATIDPTDPTLFFHTADCLLAMNKIDLALTFLDQAEILSAGNEKFDNLIEQIKLIKQAWALPSLIIKESENG